MDLSELKGKRVLVTGHTGFKGTWMCMVLQKYGAVVAGYALQPPTTPSLFELTGMGREIYHVVGDVRDLEHLHAVFSDFQPQIVVHMAAQPIVRESYIDPAGTYSTNVMGTVNVLEAIRRCPSVVSVINVTTDKVYQNFEWEWGYRETDVLNGYDPYSNSKSCSELVTSSYINAFFREKGLPVSTCRAGNVIGGGDFAKDRIIPDCVRAMENGTEILVRNPYSIRPYQHVLEPVCTYLELALRQLENPQQYQDNYNIGPDDSDCVSTGELVKTFCDHWGTDAVWKTQTEENAPHEANFLKLDCSKIKRKLGWNPRWDFNKAIEKTVEWSKVYLAHSSGPELVRVMEQQIGEYLSPERKGV